MGNDNSHNEEVCHIHSGHEARLCAVEKRTRVNEDNMGKIFTRVNIILGAISISCILLVVNLIVRLAEKSG